MKNSKYHMDLGAMTVCTEMITETKKGLYQRDVKRSTKDFFFLEFGLNQRGCLRIQWILAMTILVLLKPIQKGYVGIK